MPVPVIRIQNVYGDFLRSFKIFLDKVTMHSLKGIEWNFGSKTIEYYYMMKGEQFEFPYAIVEMQDIQPVDGVSPIARNAGMRPIMSMHNLVISENETKNQRVILDKRWVNLMFNVTINCEDVASMLTLQDLIMGSMPMNFHFYDYTYYEYIEVTDLVYKWDFQHDKISNVFQRYDSTFRYEPNVHYKEVNEDFFNSHERDRTAGKDDYINLEGYRYFAQVLMEPIIKLTSVQTQTEKEQNIHQVVISFEARIEVPNLLIWKKDYSVETIELVIDVADKTPMEHPILIDIPENFLTNKNILKGIILTPDNFVNLGGPSWITDDPLAGDRPDPTKHAHLMVNEVLDIGSITPSLWAVEDVTETSSSRFFIPLKHATILFDRDDEGVITHTRIFFKETDWFKNFNFDNGFNYLKLILFDKEAQ